MASSKYASANETDLDLCLDDNQLGLMESMSVPFNINVNFDEIPLGKGSSSNSINTHNGGMTNKNKRPIVETQLDSNKKRFVWPDALHRDFLAAVFDIGLKYASPKEIALLMSEQDASVSMDQMKSHIQKFMMFRERKDGEYVSYSDMERGVVPASSSSFSPRGGDPANNNFAEFNENIKSEKDWSGMASNSKGGSDSKSGSMRPFQPRSVSTVSPSVLLAKIETMGEAINAQSAHLANLKQLIKKQTKMYVMLSQKANQLKSTLPSDMLNPPFYNPFLEKSLRNTCSSLYPMNVVTGDSAFGLSYIDATTRNQFNDSFNYNYTQGSSDLPTGPGQDGVAHLNYLRDDVGAVADSNNSRNGFQFMHEMRAHMDTHRKLLLRKEDQLSQHGGCDFVSNLYVHDDGCTSGYNSFTDHYKYKEYKYTDEDNKSCFSKTSNGKQGVAVNSDYGITGMGRRAVPHNSNSNSHNGAGNGIASYGVPIHSRITMDDNSTVSASTASNHPSTNTVLGYYYGVSQAQKALHATSTSHTHNSSASGSNNAALKPVTHPAAATGGSGGGGVNGMVRSTSEGSAGIAHINNAYNFSHPNNYISSVGQGDWETELDLESDLFSFLFDPVN